MRAIRAVQLIANKLVDETDDVSEELQAEGLLDNARLDRLTGRGPWHDSATGRMLDPRITGPAPYWNFERHGGVWTPPEPTSGDTRPEPEEESQSAALWVPTSDDTLPQPDEEWG